MSFFLHLENDTALLINRPCSNWDTPYVHLNKTVRSSLFQNLESTPLTKEIGSH